MNLGVERNRMRVVVAIRGRRERKCCVCDENDDVDAIWRLRGK